MTRKNVTLEEITQQQIYNPAANFLWLNSINPNSLNERYYKSLKCFQISQPFRQVFTISDSLEFLGEYHIIFRHFIVFNPLTCHGQIHFQGFRFKKMNYNSELLSDISKMPGNVIFTATVFFPWFVH